MKWWVIVGGSLFLGYLYTRWQEDKGEERLDELHGHIKHARDDEDDA